MARLPRLDLAGVPQHVVQHGNNRLPCFLEDTDRYVYMDMLAESLRDTKCTLHAYNLMGNHVHLLVTAPVPGAVSVMMQKLGRKYVARFNRRHGRTGTLWEGRFKSCLVDTEEYLLRCCRYIDLNSVRARMTDDPRQFKWSSCAGHCGDRQDSLLTPHAAYLALGNTSVEQAVAYCTLLRASLDDDQLDEIRACLQQQCALGRNAFQAMVEAKTRRFAGMRPAHRPPKSPRHCEK